MASVRVIVLEHQSLGAGLGSLWTLALWADVPATRQAFYANPSATSAWKDAQAGDLTALQTGAVVERILTLQQNAGQTLADMQAVAAAEWTAYQAYITARNPWDRYGTTYNTDGSWTPRSVA